MISNVHFEALKHEPLDFSLCGLSLELQKTLVPYSRMEGLEMQTISTSQDCLVTSRFLLLVASLLPVAMPFVPSSFLLQC